jgi:membrane-bound metal-dependent hydrolase YbcI (DUF457 family)
MANGKTHTAVAVTTGVMAAAVMAEEPRDGFRKALQLIGGGVGGYIGGRLPDVLEPPTSSWHRDLCHSWLVGAGTVGITQRLEGWRRFCEQEARRSRIAYTARQGLNADTSPACFEEVIWLMAAGFIPGLLFGYLSHLALDACTPRGLPLLGRGACD